MCSSDLNDYSGIVISLSNHQHPDTEDFNDPEIYWRMDMEHHIGFIVKSDNRERILEILEDYTHRIYEKYHASAPVPDKPSH